MFLKFVIDDIMPQAVATTIIYRATEDYLPVAKILLCDAYNGFVSVWAAIVQQAHWLQADHLLRMNPLYS